MFHSSCGDKNCIKDNFIAGFLTDQEEYREHLEMSRRYENYSSEKYKDDRFHLSNISFAGPVVLGIGGEVFFFPITQTNLQIFLSSPPGFLMIAACVMTLEARDNAAKIVPATACLESPPNLVRKPKNSRENRFQSSASQTTFIDRDIVAVLTGSQNSKQKSVDRPSCSDTRRFSSGSAQLPETSGSTMTPDMTDTTRHARTKAFVNGDCLVKEGIHKCPSAPCISHLEGKSDMFKVICENENRQRNFKAEKW